MNGHSIKLQFCMFEKSQGKHNSLNWQKFLKNIFHWLQSTYVQSLTQIKNVFTCSKHSNLKNAQSFFFKPFFFLPNVHHLFWKLERILTLNIKRAKGLEIMLFLNNQFEHIWFKCVFTLKIMDFENVALTKVVHIYVIKGINA